MAWLPLAGQEFIGARLRCHRDQKEDILGLVALKDPDRSGNTVTCSKPTLTAMHTSFLTQMLAKTKALKHQRN